MNEANVGLSQWDANWASAWNIFHFLLKKSLCRSTIPLPLTLQLDLSPVTVANLADRGPEGKEGWKERKVEAKEKCISPKKLSTKFAGVILFPRGGCSLPVSPGGVWTEDAAAICVLV